MKKEQKKARFELPHVAYGIIRRMEDREPGWVLWDSVKNLAELKKAMKRFFDTGGRDDGILIPVKITTERVDINEKKGVKK